MNKEGKEIYLGLDVSTQCIGICILIDDGSEYGKILELTHISPKVSSKIKGIEQLFLKKKIFEALHMNNGNSKEELLFFNARLY